MGPVKPVSISPFVQHFRIVYASEATALSNCVSFVLGMGIQNMGELSF